MGSACMEYDGKEDLAYLTAVAVGVGVGVEVGVVLPGLARRGVVHFAGGNEQRLRLFLTIPASANVFGSCCSSRMSRMSRLGGRKRIMGR